MGGIIRSAAFLFVPFLVFGEMIEVDVGAWADVETGMTNGWEVSGISRTDDGLTRVKEIADYARSPEFDFNVTQLVMKVLCANAGTKRFLTITPTVSEPEAKRHAAERSTKLTEQIFAWDSSEGVRQFRLQNDTGEGSTSWGIAALTVYTDNRVRPPTGLREDALYRDAFAAVWDPASEAVRYDVRYASVARTPPNYETVAEWDFSSLTNTHGGNPRTFDQLKKDNPEKLDDLTGTNVCMEKYTGGHIQIGQSEKLGLLGFPTPSVPEGSGPLTGILRAWKHPDDSKCLTMPIYLVADGVTNDLVTLGLTVDRTDYRFPIPKDVAIESIILSSTTNLMTQKESHGRVRVESFAIVSGYVPGSVTTNEFRSVETRTTEKTVTGLAPGEWIWSVRSFDAEGMDSLWSPFRTVILDPKGRSYSPPGCLLLIR